MAYSLLHALLKAWTNNAFARNLVKGKIAETICCLLFAESGEFIITPYEYDHTIPAFAQYHKDVQLHQVLAITSTTSGISLIEVISSTSGKGNSAVISIPCHLLQQIFAVAYQRICNFSMAHQKPGTAKGKLALTASNKTY